MAGRGMRGRKVTFMPRGEEKEKREGGKPWPGGAWEEEKRHSCPAEGEKRR